MEQPVSREGERAFFCKGKKLPALATLHLPEKKGFFFGTVFD
ncbi:hypothetical protein [Salidesulfovibrio brasiliensis]|nr:hypothetical protein [Salidesulfovibrio brasiliensis]